MGQRPSRPRAPGAAADVERPHPLRDPGGVGDRELRILLETGTLAELEAVAR